MVATPTGAHHDQSPGVSPSKTSSCERGFTMAKRPSSGSPAKHLRTLDLRLEKQPLSCLTLTTRLGALSALSQPASTEAPGTNWAVQQFHEADALFAYPGQAWMSQARSPMPALALPVRSFISGLTEPRRPARGAEARSGLWTCLRLHK